MRYEVWAVEWYAELDKAFCVGCADTVRDAGPVIRDFRKATSPAFNFHFDVRVKR